MLLIYLVVIFGVLGVVWWAFTQFNLPQPFRIVAVVVVVIIALLLLLQLVGGGGIHLPR